MLDHLPVFRVLRQCADDVRIGDHVAILLGCDVPTVLRRTGIENAHHIIGCCYINGFMNGEALLGAAGCMHHGEPVVRLAATVYIACGISTRHQMRSI